MGTIGPAELGELHAPMARPSRALRMAIGSLVTEERHVEDAWTLLRETAASMTSQP